ncbi:hypothetical protein, partial [Actinomyces sp. Z3]|uniref:hypothetical protein n=1 Tax=Actinomyces sp. Z3 TaxID=2250217 RepID=UPI001C65B2EA
EKKGARSDARRTGPRPGGCTRRAGAFGIGVKPRVLWRLFYLAPVVAGWGWLAGGLLADVCASAVSVVSGGGVYACSCSIGACMSMAE